MRNGRWSGGDQMWERERERERESNKYFGDIGYIFVVLNFKKPPQSPRFGLMSTATPEYGKYAFFSPINLLRFGCYIDI
jgi:hypothetical protein